MTRKQWRFDRVDAVLSAGEDAHRHDDGNHDHHHDSMPDGAHSHWLSHAAVGHAHPYVPDSHHLQRH